MQSLRPPVAALSLSRRSIRYARTVPRSSIFLLLPLFSFFAYAQQPSTASNPASGQTTQQIPNPAGGFAQQGSSSVTPETSQQPAGTPAPAAQNAPVVVPPGSGLLSLDYVLGPDDALVVHAYEMEDEIPDRPVLVERDGTIQLPILGKIKAEGLTVQQLEETVADKLKKYVREPKVNVTIVRFRSEPIFVEGAFRAPGIYQLQQHKTLLDLITAIGLQPDASHIIRITRRLEYGEIPLASAVQQSGAKTTTVEIDISSVKEGTNPVGNLELKPYDVISAKQAEMIYVLGRVGRNGPIEIGEHESLSILQVLSMSGGTGPDAGLDKTVILRPTLEVNRRSEIHVNVKRILTTQDEDFTLKPNDILYIPGKSGAKHNMAVFAKLALPMIPYFLWLIVR